MYVFIAYITMLFFSFLLFHIRHQCIKFIPLLMRGFKQCIVIIILFLIVQLSQGISCEIVLCKFKPFNIEHRTTLVLRLKIYSVTRQCSDIIKTTCELRSSSWELLSYNLFTMVQMLISVL